MKNQKTVLVISPSLGIGGRERIAINTVRCLEGLGYRAVLVLLQRRDVEYPFSSGPGRSFGCGSSMTSASSILWERRPTSPTSCPD